MKVCKRRRTRKFLPIFDWQNVCRSLIGKISSRSRKVDKDGRTKAARKRSSRKIQAHQRPRTTSIVLHQEDLSPNIPEEIILDILSRLPVKSILKFRCVSKSWCCMISNPQFVQTHLRMSTRADNLSTHYLLLEPMYNRTGLYTCSLHSVLYEKFPVNAVKILPWERFGYLDCVGGCNGLYCIYERPDFILLNPATRKTKRLQNGGFLEYYGYTVRYGFGYDETHDDYKIVEIVHYGSKLNGKTTVSVYSLRNNSWRRIEDYKCGFLAYRKGVFVNGAIHFQVSFGDGDNNPLSSHSILSLNLASETYGELIPPNYDKSAAHKLLGVFRGCLSLFCGYHDEQMDVWVMNEYGVNESWTKLLSIPNHTVMYSLLFVSEADEILVDRNSTLSVYNRRTKIFDPRDVTVGDCLFKGTSATYIESLVSP